MKRYWMLGVQVGREHDCIPIWAIQTLSYQILICLNSIRNMVAWVVALVDVRLLNIPLAFPTITHDRNIVEIVPIPIIVNDRSPFHNASLLRAQNSNPHNRMCHDWCPDKSF